jgi:hypothetical protein
MFRSRSVLIVTALLFCLPGCGSRSPGTVLKNALQAANEGNYEKATEALNSTWRKMLDDKPSQKMLWDGVTVGGTIKGVEILKEETRGEGGTVSYRIRYSDSRTWEGKVECVQEGGAWKIEPPEPPVERVVPKGR